MKKTTTLLVGLILLFGVGCGMTETEPKLESIFFEDADEFQTWVDDVALILVDMDDRLRVLEN